MAGLGDYRELLFAEVALARGLVDEEQVAVALTAMASSPEDRPDGLEDALVGTGAISPAGRAEVEADIARQIAEAGGDVRVVLSRRGMLATVVHEAIAKTRGIRPDPAREAPTADARLRPYAEGRYLDFTPAGQGGMGMVYWALDTDLNREVALKVLQPGSGAGRSTITPASPEALDAPGADPRALAHYDVLRSRFLLEAWITAGLTHPNIVPVYELGTNSQGVPYYTMRFVRGRRTFADALAETSPDTRLELLEPFLKVVDAVRFAHSQGVIHRDLKPSNVALGEYGEVVLLDWGLARLEGRDDLVGEVWREHIEAFRAETDMHTRMAVGTPGYMAPEATLGDGKLMDERSDVYGLGVMLYEILAMRRPFQFATYEEYAERVVVERPEPPSARATGVPAALSDLCLRALIPERDERLASAAELAHGIRDWQRQERIEHEVERHLTEARTALELGKASKGDGRLASLDRAAAACQSVFAHRPGHERARTMQAEVDSLRVRSRIERERRARRRLLTRVAAAVLVVATITTVIVAGVLAERRRQAVRESRRSEELSRFMLLDLHERLERMGRIDLLEDVARQTLEHYAAFTADEMTADRRAMRAVALENTGSVLLGQGFVGEAGASLAEALQLVRDLRAAEPEAAAWKRMHARLLRKLGQIHARQQAYEIALGELADAARLQEALYESGESQPEDAEALFTTLGAMGDVQGSRGEAEAMGASFARALQLAEEPQRDLRPHTWRPKLVRALHGLTAAARIHGDLGKADALVRRALAIASSYAKEYPHAEEGLVSLANAHMAMALSHRDAERLASALASYEATVALCEQLTSGVRYNLDRASQVVAARNGAADMYQERRDYPDAIRHCKASERALKEVLARDPGRSRWRQDLADVHRRLGGLRYEQGAVHASRFNLGSARRTFDELLKEDPTNRVWQEEFIRCAIALGRTLLAMGKPADAGALGARAAPIARRLLASDPANVFLQAWTARVAALEGHADLAAGALDAARQAYGRAIRQQEKVVGQRPQGWPMQELAAYRRFARHVELLTSPEKATDPDDLLLLAEAQSMQRRPVRATRTYQLAFELSVLPAPRIEDHLWNAARSAVKGSVDDADRSGRALTWLAELASRLRRRLPRLLQELQRAATDDARFGWQRAVNEIQLRAQRIRIGESAFEALRPTPGFQQVLEALPPAR